MRLSKCYALFTLAVATLLVAGHAGATVVDFTAGQGYANGDLTNNVNWTTLGDDESGNIVSNSAPGYAGVGIVTLATAEWHEVAFSEALPMAVEGDTAMVKYRFRYTATNALPLLTQAGLFSAELAGVESNDTARTGLRRRNVSGASRLVFWTNGDPAQGDGPSAPETEVGITNATDTSHWLEFSSSLTRGSGTDDWTYRISLSNLVTGIEVLSQTIPAYPPRAGLLVSTEVQGRISSGWQPFQSGTVDRMIDRFEVVSSFIEPPLEPVVIISGAVGDGDFEYPEVPGSPATVTGPLWYTNHPNWFNASASDGINFSNDSQMNGSSQAGSRGGMPFKGRVQVNNSPYTIAAEGEVFSLSYDFGAGGNLAAYSNTTMSTYLFTTVSNVNGALTTNDMTILGGDDYPIGRWMGDPQWTTRTVENFYTSTAADVGKTVYFGMVFVQPVNTSFPRIDVIRLQVTPVPSPVLIDGFDLATGGAEVWLTWPAGTARDTYSVAAVDVLDGSWSNLATGIKGTPAQNIYTTSVGSASATFYRIEREPRQPFLDEDFESGASGWTKGKYNGASATEWELGTPNYTSAAVITNAHSGSNAYGTDLDGAYDFEANPWLRSPVVDLAGATSASLTFWHARHIEDGFDAVSVNVLTNGVMLVEGIYSNLTLNVAWTETVVPLPASAMGQQVVLEFELLEDSFPVPPNPLNDLGGWYIDDILVDGP